MPDQERIIAIGLLTQRDLDMLGQGFKRAFPIEETPQFDDLLKAIDQADHALLTRGDGKH